MTKTNSVTTPEGDQEAVPQVGFSVEELQYLLSIAPGPSADRSAELFNVTPVPSVDDTILVGGAALLARGQLEFLEGGEFKPVDAALVIAYILANATRWSTLTGATEQSADVGVFVESPHGGILAQPRTLGTWWFIILDPASVPAEIILASAMGMANEADTTGVVVQTTTLEHDRTFSIRHDGDGWAFAYGDTGSNTPEQISEGATIEELVTELASFAAYFPRMS